MVHKDPGRLVSTDSIWSVQRPILLLLKQKDIYSKYNVKDNKTENIQFLFLTFRY